MNWKKILIIGGIVLVVVIIVGASVAHNSQGVVGVQMGMVKAQDLTSTVTASGQIKPKTFVNIGANAFGKIVKLYVKEGDHVARGQKLAQLENVQSAADVGAQRATLTANQADAIAAEAGLNTAVAELNRDKADLVQKKLGYQRAEGLFQSELISKADYDARKAAYEAADANVAQAQARIAQSKAQQQSAAGLCSGQCGPGPGRHLHRPPRKPLCGHRNRPWKSAPTETALPPAGNQASSAPSPPYRDSTQPLRCLARPQPRWHRPGWR